MRAWCVYVQTHTHISEKSGKKNSAVVQVALRQQYDPECSISPSPSVQPEEIPTPRLLLLSTNRLVFFSHAHSCWCPCVSPYFPINASPMLPTASGVLRCRDVCERWECCIACMHQLLSGFIDSHAINHSKCTDLQLGCSGANAFFNKVDIGHTRAHHRRVSVTLACVNLESFLMRWEKTVHQWQLNYVWDYTRLLLTQGLCAQCWCSICIIPDCLFVLFYRDVQGKCVLLLSVYFQLSHTGPATPAAIAPKVVDSKRKCI